MLLGLSSAAGALQKQSDYLMVPVILYLTCVEVEQTSCSIFS